MFRKRCCQFLFGWEGFGELVMFVRKVLKCVISIFCVQRFTTIETLYPRFSNIETSRSYIFLLDTKVLNHWSTLLILRLIPRLSTTDTRYWCYARYQGSQLMMHLLILCEIPKIFSLLKYWIYWICYSNLTISVSITEILYLCISNVWYRGFPRNARREKPRPCGDDNDPCHIRSPYTVSMYSFCALYYTIHMLHIYIYIYIYIYTHNICVYVYIYIYIT